MAECHDGGCFCVLVVRFLRELSMQIGKKFRIWLTASFFAWTGVSMRENGCVAKRLEGIGEDIVMARRDFVCRYGTEKV